jgi:hypothetical protein
MFLHPWIKMEGVTMFPGMETCTTPGRHPQPRLHDIVDHLAIVVRAGQHAFVIGIASRYRSFAIGFGVGF